MFRAHVLIIRRSKLHYTASGVITPIGGRLVDETACKTLVLRYIATCGLCGCTVFFAVYFINGKISGKKVVEHKMYVLDLSTRLKIHRDAAITVHSSSCKVLFCSRQFLKENEFLPQIFKRYTNVKFHE